MPSLYKLREFFKTGRMMDETVNVLDAIDQNLGCLSGDELISLRESARLFIQKIESAHVARWQRDDGA